MDRRGFLDRVATLIHWGVAACAVIPGLGFIAVRRDRKQASGNSVRTVRLDELKPGVPLRVIVTAGRRDAYVQHPPGPIGSVWLILDDDPTGSAASTVRCLQTICPHLGCAIDFAADRGAFFCPCHASEFALSGAANFGPSPRPMDELPCRVTEPDESGTRWIEIEYHTFRTGRVEQVRLT